MDNIEPLPHQSVDRRRKMMDAVLWQVEHMHEIPALIIACMELGTKRDPMVLGERVVRFGLVLGIYCSPQGSGFRRCSDDTPLIDQEAVAKVLKLPGRWAHMSTRGLPLGRFGPVTRKPVEDIVRFDTELDHA